MSCDAERRDPELAEMVAAHCADCATMAQCKHAFGKFWAIKSRDGVGCAYPFPPPSSAPLPPPVPSGREPWQGKVFATRRREDGVFKPRKRKEKTMRQGTLL
jgi:hypothetical protein